VPLERFDPESFDSRRGDETAFDLLELMGAVLVKAYASRLVHRKANPAAPPEPVRSARHIRDLYEAFDAGYASKLLSHEIGLQRPLRPQLDVLPVTASTATGSRVWAWRGHTIRRGLDYLDRVRS